MLGDDEFERSRGRAQEAHDRQEKQLTLDRNAESALRKLVEIKTGKPAAFPKLAELPKLWLQIPRRGMPGKHYVAQCTSILERFVAFVRDRKPGIKEFLEVTPEIAKAYPGCRAGERRVPEHVELQSRAAADHVQEAAPAIAPRPESVSGVRHQVSRYGRPGAVHAGRAQGNPGGLRPGRFHPPGGHHRHVHGDAAGRLLLPQVDGR